MELNMIIEKLENGEKIEDLIKITKEYIPILEKRNIIKTVLNRCLFTDEGTEMLQCDEFLKELYLIPLVIISCTDVEVDNLIVSEETEDGAVNDFDLEMTINTVDIIKKYKIDRYIYQNTDLDVIEYALDTEIQQRKEIYNSPAMILSKAIKSIINIIPNQNAIENLFKEFPQHLSQLNDLKVLGGKKTKKVTQ
jgi:hypothetical protein